jgi:hypothetical protein
MFPPTSDAVLQATNIVVGLASPELPTNPDTTILGVRVRVLILALPPSLLPSTRGSTTTTMIIYYSQIQIFMQSQL